MRVKAGAILKKLSTLTVAGVLALSSLAAAVPLFVSQTALAAPTAAYNGIPATLPPSFPSLGYEATSTNEFGDEVQLAGVNRELNNIAVSFTDWACQNDYTKTSPSDPCVTTPGSSFTHPITVNIYAATASDTVGALLATTTDTVTVPFRPSADPTCTDKTMWKDSDGACHNGLAFTHTFNFSTSPQITLPNKVIVGIAYNTQNYGAHPLNIAGPYNSLNVSLATTPPTIGADVNSDVMFWNTNYAGFYSDNGAGGTGTLRPDTGWSSYSLAMTINANTAVTPVPTSPKFFKGTAEVPVGSTLNAAANVNSVEFKWAASGADQYQTQITYPNGHASRTVWTGTQNVWIGETSGTGWSNNNFFGQDGDGTYTYSVKARSATTGLWSNWTTPVSLVYDNSAPTIISITANSVALPDTGKLLPGTNTTFTVNLSDTPSGPYGAYIELFKANWDGTYGTWQKDNTSGGGSVMYGATPKLVANLSAYSGAYGLKIVARDNVGNSVTKYVFFTIDNTVPAAPLLLTANPYIANGDTKTLAWSKSTSSDVAYYQYAEYNGTAPTSDTTPPSWIKNVTGTTTADTAWRSDINIYWRVQAVDYAGNVGPWSETREIITDRTAPQVAISSPILNDTIGGNTLTITGTASDANFKDYRFYVKNTDTNTIIGNNGWSKVGTTAVTNGTLGTWDLTNLPSGHYTISLNVNDIAGNHSWAGRNFIIDHTAPILTATPTPGSVAAGSTVALSTDDSSATIYYTTDGTTPDTSSSKYISPLVINSTETIKAIAYDTLGNASPVLTNTYTISLNTTPTSTTTITTSSPTATPQVVAVAISPAQPAIATTSNQGVLGASTTTPSTTNPVKTSNPAAVLGAATNQSKTTKSSFSWYWWILVVIAIGIIALAIRNYLRRADTNKK